MSFAAGAFSSGVGGRGGGGEGGRRLFNKAKDNFAGGNKDGQEGNGSSITASLMFHAMASMGPGSNNKVTQSEGSANKENAKDNFLHPNQVDCDKTNLKG